MSHNYFQRMAELQSFIERQIEQKAHNLKEINFLILSNFLEFQKQNKEFRNFPEFQKQNQALRKELQEITTFANTQIRNIQTEMYWCERNYISEMEKEVHEDTREQEFEEEFEKVSSIYASLSKKVKCSFSSYNKNSSKKRIEKVTKNANTFDRKFVMKNLNSNNKTKNKLPRVIIEQMIHSLTKPKHKNRGL